MSPLTSDRMSPTIYSSDTLEQRVSEIRLVWVNRNPRPAKRKFRATLKIVYRNPKWRAA